MVQFTLNGITHNRYKSENKGLVQYIIDRMQTHDTFKGKSIVFESFSFEEKSYKNEHDIEISKDNELYMICGNQTINDTNDLDIKMYVKFQ